MDGSDDRLPLIAMDRAAKLSEQVLNVEQNLRYMHSTGQVSRVICFLTGDGKGMQSMHFREGCRCWVCVKPWNSLKDLKIQEDVPPYVRIGSFLRTIPVARRVGDYAHCACRVVNAMLIRCYDICC